MKTNYIYNGGCLEIMKDFPDLRRKGIGIEGKKEYCKIFEDRFFQRYGMLKEII